MTQLPRVIPVLLLSEGYLVKPTRFRHPTYIGDPVNAVKIYNEKLVDELVILDIDATPKGTGINYGLLQDIASEAFMPVAYGGGIKTVDDARQILALGIEKVVLSASAHANPSLIHEIAAEAGSQSVVISIDVRRHVLGRQTVHVNNGRVSTGKDPVAWAREAAALGAGELIVSSIDREGTFSGYDTRLVHEVANSVDIPVIALGGAGRLSDFSDAVTAGAAAVAAGSMFVFTGKHRAVLITYPDQEAVESISRNRSDA